MRKAIVALLVMLTLALLIPSIWVLLQPALHVAAPIEPTVPSVPDESVEATSSPTPVPTPSITTLRFSATGDNLVHNGIYQQAERRAAEQGKSGYDFSYCFDHVREFYAHFDINWLNQETLVNDELEPSTYPTFSTPGDMGRAAYDAGFRVFSLSNNHSYDKGAAGIAATRRFWASMPEDVITCGLYDPESPAIDIQEKNGVKIAYLSYTEHTNGINHPKNAEAQVIYTKQTDVIEEQIKQARQMADLVVVSTHWGVEGSHKVTDAQRSLAQQMAEWGADVIIGTHPHVVQDAEWLTSESGHRCFVAYSLGNFLNAQSNADCMIGVVLTFDIVKTVQPNGDSATVIENPLLVPVINHYGKNYAQICVYMRKDYTDALAKAHGVREKAPGFSLDYIDKVLQSSISHEFLA